MFILVYVSIDSSSVKAMSKFYFIEVSNVSPLEGRNMMLHLSQVTPDTTLSQFVGKNILSNYFYIFFIFPHLYEGAELGG